MMGGNHKRRSRAKLYLTGRGDYPGGRGLCNRKLLKVLNNLWTGIIGRVRVAARLGAAGDTEGQFALGRGPKL